MSATDGIDFSWERLDGTLTTLSPPAWMPSLAGRAQSLTKRYRAATIAVNNEQSSTALFQANKR